ncbi:MAG TPA: hypothetical protein VMH91_00310 [Candidatus Paceibacterota bacterium]|nr:hypothetical protein [Candidatus Paceibacterota bacterium]
MNRSQPSEEERRTALRESMERVTKEQREVADELLRWLLIDGLEFRLTIDDIKRIIVPGKDPEAVRKVIALTITALRPKP